jgi:hypothetical protein
MLFPPRGASTFFWQETSPAASAMTVMIPVFMGFVFYRWLNNITIAGTPFRSIIVELTYDVDEWKRNIG